MRECTYSLGMVSRYQKRISSPLLDRIDIHIDVPRVEYEKLSDERFSDPSADIRERVEAAREFCRVDDASRNLLRAAMEQPHMSARAYDELSWSSPHPEAGAHHCRPDR